MRKAGVVQANGRTPIFSFHSLRHTYAALLIAAKVPVLEVSRLMGHAKVTTTLERYGYLFEEEAKGRAAMEEISQDLTPLLAPTPMRRICDKNGEVIEDIETS